MATATATKQNGKGGDIVPSDKVSVQYQPLAEVDQITVTMPMVRNTLCTPSKSGKLPADRDVITFMMLCKSRRLNPFVGDAYLIGYDSSGGTSWSLITAVQALRKRAESHPQYDGYQRGVILLVDKELVEREGSLVLDNEQLVGGWAVCGRKDQQTPYRETVKLSVYSTGLSRWAKDPGGMIVKVAEAAALRRAFPSDLAGLYLREEFDREDRDQHQVEQAAGMEGLRNRLAGIERREPESRDENTVDAEPSEMEKALAPKPEKESKTDTEPTPGRFDYWMDVMRKQKTIKGRGNVLADATSDRDKGAITDGELLALEALANQMTEAAAANRAPEK